jgi:hypothetical protein
MQLDQPFCQPFGNRKLLHCSKDGDRSKGEVPAWEACGKAISLERRYYWEFVVRFLSAFLSVNIALWARGGHNGCPE